MKKILILSAAILSALTAATAGAAETPKHYRGGYYGNGGGYVAPARGYYAPVRGGYYAPARGGYYGQNRGGYWHGNRWIAPVAIAAAIGGLAIAGGSYYYNQPSYVAPSYVEPSYYGPAEVSYGVNYAAPVADGFANADTNGDGYVSFDEAAMYPHWQRNFGNIDRNRDGYLSRDEVAGWRYR